MMGLAFGVLDGKTTGLKEILKWVESVKKSGLAEMGMMTAEEFFNRCHDPKTGKFCSAGTPGARIVGMTRAAKILRLAKKEGGATLNIDTLESVKSGYAVGVRPKRSAVYPDSAVGKQKIEKWLKDNESELRKPGMNVGVWYDKKTGALWLDVTKVYPNTSKGKSLAMRAAGRHEQIAIFHLDSLSEIEHGKADEFRRKNTPTS